MTECAPASNTSPTAHSPKGNCNMNDDLSTLVLDHLSRSHTPRHVEQIRNYLKNDMADPPQAFRQLKAFLKTNRLKMRKWAKFVKQGNQLPTDLSLYDRITYNREDRRYNFVRVPAYVNVYCCNGSEEYYDDVTRCHPWKENLDEYYILQNICKALWLIARKEQNKCITSLHGRVDFVKVGLNRFKMTFDPMRNSPYDPYLDGTLEIYDNGNISVKSVSYFYGIGDTCMDSPVEATYRYQVKKCLSTGIFISLFVKTLPHIQEYLDRVEKLYDRKYAKEDTNILQRIRDFFTYDNDRAGHTF